MKKNNELKNYTIAELATEIENRLPAGAGVACGQTTIDDMLEYIRALEDRILLMGNLLDCGYDADMSSLLSTTCKRIKEKRNDEDREPNVEDEDKELVAALLRIMTADLET